MFSLSLLYFHMTYLVNKAYFQNTFRTCDMFNYRTYQDENSFARLQRF
jgi:hypothetical protein